MIEIYTPMTDIELSNRKAEEYANWTKIVQWGRLNSVAFAEEVFGTQLMDFQRYIMLSSWDKQFALWLCCRAFGKDTLGAIMQMATMMLFPNWRVYISCNSYTQSLDTMNKMRDLALKKIPSFASLTDIFAREIDKTGTNSETGFIQSPPAHFELFNNSGCEALTSNLDTARGKRGSVWFNETGWKDQEALNVIENFANVNSSFKTSTKSVNHIDPPNMPLRILYTSSASSIDTPFYDKYKSFYKKMISGDPNYFVVDLDAYALLSYSSINGEKIKSHLSEERIKKDVEEDPEGAERELFNHFRKGGGKDSLIQLGEIMRNSTPYAPIMRGDGKQKFIFTYDPARNFDGSILSIWLVEGNKKDEYRLRWARSVSMVDVNTKNKTPLNMVRQIEIIRQLLLDYNGEAPEYENITFYIDAGAGGGGVSAVADQLLKTWKTSDGIEHVGLIDPEHKQYETARMNPVYRQNSPIIRLVEPTSHKRIMYDSLAKMIKSNLITFPDWDGKDYILIGDENNSKKEFVQYDLTDEDKRALGVAMIGRQQLSYIVRYETSSGSVSYDLAKDKARKMHDDIAYTYAEAGYALYMLRRNTIVKDDRNVRDETFILSRSPVLRKY